MMRWIIVLLFHNTVYMNSHSFSDSQANQKIPNWLIWIQCVAFAVLYAFWTLPEIVGFRNTALVVGALAGLLPIYRFRSQLLGKRAISIWLIVILFVWATFHLLFLAQDFPAQLLEYKRIWKYAAIGAIFAFGLGLSLAGPANKSLASGRIQPANDSKYWPLIYFGLSLPILIYLLKYTLTTYGVAAGIQVPAYLQIYFSSQPYYVPKTDYVAFCLPTLAVALGQIQNLWTASTNLRGRQYLPLFFYLAIIAATLFLFDKQNIKNGMAYAALCLILFLILFLLNGSQGRLWKKLVVVVGLVCLSLSFYPHVQKNDSWKTLIVDTKVAFQLDKYQQWKYAGAQGYPHNEYGKIVSITNYERAAWFKVGLQLAADQPLGYGLVEDSFKGMAKAKWPEASPNLSHSHSGWLDLILAIGFPGFICVFGALILVMAQSKQIVPPWRELVFWGLFANMALWITTEVSATITFSALIFWISLSAGLILRGPQEIGIDG